MYIILFLVTLPDGKAIKTSTTFRPPKGSSTAAAGPLRLPPSRIAPGLPPPAAAARYAAGAAAAPRQRPPSLHCYATSVSSRRPRGVVPNTSESSNCPGRLAFLEEYREPYDPAANANCAAQYTHWRTDLTTTQQNPPAAAAEAGGESDWFLQRQQQL